MLFCFQSDSTEFVLPLSDKAEERQMEVTQMDGTQMEWTQSEETQMEGTQTEETQMNANVMEWQAENTADNLRKLI